MFEFVSEEENEYSDESNNYSIESKNEEIELFIQTKFNDALYSDNIIIELQNVIDICKEYPLEGNIYEYQSYEYITIYAFRNKNLELYLINFKYLFEKYPKSLYINKDKSLKKIFSDIDMNLNTLYDFINDSLNILEKLKLLDLRNEIIDIIKEKKIPIDIEENTPYDLIIYPKKFSNLQYKNVNSEINIKYKCELYSNSILINSKIYSITFLGEIIAIEDLNYISFYQIEDNNKEYIDNKNLINKIPKIGTIINIELINDNFGFYVTNTIISFFNLKNEKKYKHFKFNFIYHSQLTNNKNIFCLTGYYKEKFHQYTLIILSPQQQFNNYQIQTQIELKLELKEISLPNYHNNNFIKYLNPLKIFSDNNEGHNQIKINFPNDFIKHFNITFYCLLETYHNIIKIIELKNFYVIQIYQNIFIFQKNCFYYFQSTDILNEIYGGKNDTFIEIKSFGHYIIYECNLYNISTVSEIKYYNLNILYDNISNYLMEKNILQKYNSYFKKNNFLFIYQAKIKYNIIQIEKIKINLNCQ